MTIESIPRHMLVKIVADLVARGLTFRAIPDDSGLWTIQLTGGY